MSAESSKVRRMIGVGDDPAALVEAVLYVGEQLERLADVIENERKRGGTLDRVALAVEKVAARI
jgi:hypothetical protein